MGSFFRNAMYLSIRYSTKKVILRWSRLKISEMSEDIIKAIQTHLRIFPNNSRDYFKLHVKVNIEFFQRL